MSAATCPECEQQHSRDSACLPPFAETFESACNCQTCVDAAASPAEDGRKNIRVSPAPSGGTWYSWRCPCGANVQGHAVEDGSASCAFCRREWPVSVPPASPTGEAERARAVADVLLEHAYYERPDACACGQWRGDGFSSEQDHALHAAHAVLAAALAAVVVSSPATPAGRREAWYEGAQAATDWIKSGAWVATMPDNPYPASPATPNGQEGCAQCGGSGEFNFPAAPAHGGPGFIGPCPDCSPDEPYEHWRDAPSPATPAEDGERKCQHCGRTLDMHSQWDARNDHFFVPAPPASPTGEGERAVTVADETEALRRLMSDIDTLLHDAPDAVWGASKVLLHLRDVRAAVPVPSLPEEEKP